MQSATDMDRWLIEDLQGSISPDSGCNIQVNLFFISKFFFVILLNYFLKFTSGTTGLPKATLLSHFGMVNNAFNIGIRNEFHKKESRLCMPLPMFHVGGCIISTIGALWHGIPHN